MRGSKSHVILFLVLFVIVSTAFFFPSSNENNKQSLGKDHTTSDKTRGPLSSQSPTSTPDNCVQQPSSKTSHPATVTTQVVNKASLVVLGMHRSGTSMLTGLISQCLGVYAGERSDLLEGSSGNQKGYYERMDLITANINVLSKQRLIQPELLTDCSQMTFPKVSWRKDLTAKQSKYLMFEDLKQHEMWVIKDPRLCLTYEYYANDIENPVFIIPIRHPIEVAKSLARRQNLPVGTSLSMWYTYVLNAIRITSGQKRLFLYHHDVVTNTPAFIAKLQRQLIKLGVPLRGYTEEELTTCAGGWVDPNLLTATNLPDDKEEGGDYIDEFGQEEFLPEYQELWDNLKKGKAIFWTYEDLPPPYNFPMLNCTIKYK